MSWTQRLHLEDDTGCGFDFAWCEQAGFLFNIDPEAGGPPSVTLTGMGPKLLLSDISTRDQPTLRWRLLVRGNTAVEFGCLPVNLEPGHTVLHKCQAVPKTPDERCAGFCSQITAGSLLPVKVPIMRGCVLDIILRRGALHVLILYPPNAKEITWQGGQPVQRAYNGPTRLSFEQEFSDAYDVRLAVTSWAKASYDILHTGYSRIRAPAKQRAQGEHAPISVLDAFGPDSDSASLVGSPTAKPLPMGGDSDINLNAQCYGFHRLASSLPAFMTLNVRRGLPKTSTVSGSLATLESPELGSEPRSNDDSAQRLQIFPFSSSQLVSSGGSGISHPDSRVAVCCDGHVPGKCRSWVVDDGKKERKNGCAG